MEITSLSSLDPSQTKKLIDFDCHGMEIAFLEVMDLYSSLF